MRVAVTGGSGIVGSALVRHLVDGGHRVQALARSEASATTLSGMGAMVVMGDLTDPGALDALVRSSEWVFHVAGVNEFCSRDPDAMWRVNVDGTRMVLDACEKAGVGRLVHTSSAVTLGEAHGTVGSEGSSHRGSFLSDYERSKHAAEKLVFEEARGFDVVAVNPSSVQGPGRATGSGALLLEAARGRWPVLIDAVFSLVDIDDCARGHLAAATSGVNGERYVLNGTVVSVREVVGVVNRLMDRRWHPWYLNRSVLKGMAPIAGRLTRLRGGETFLCSESVRVLLNGHRYDGSRATRELGLDYVPLEETLSRTIDWFAAQGLLN